MKKLFLLTIMMTILWSVGTVEGVVVKLVWIKSVHTELIQPTHTDSITIIATGKACSGGVVIEGSNFRMEGTSVELDIFFRLGPYGMITPWSHSEVIGTLPANSYELTVRAFNYSTLDDAYFLTDTYLTSFTVVPGPPIEADIEIEPKTLNLKSKGKWLTCRIWLPEDYNVADIEPNSVRLENEPNDIYAEWIWFEDEDEVAMAKFSRSELKQILVPGEVELTVTGELADGSIFEGTDVIRVIDKGGKKK